VYQVNNSVIFNGKPVESEDFLNQMVEVLGIIIDRRPKGRPRKMGKDHRKNRIAMTKK